MLKSLLIALTTLLSTSLNAQITFQKAYGGPSSEGGKYVQQTFDDGYIAVGTSTSFGAGGRDIYVVKTNAFGDTLWTKTFGGATDNEYGFCIQQTTDSGYIVSGVASSFVDVAGDMYLIKLNSTGDTSWTRTFGGIGYEWGSYVQQTTDGGYILIGQTPAFGAGGFDAYLVKVNSSGDLLWTKTYGFSGSELGSAVQQTNDGGYILTGQIDTYGAGAGDFYLIKTDSAGNVSWTKVFGITGEEAGVSVKQTTDGGFVLAGSSASSTTLSRDMCLIKTNSIGDIEWAKTYGGSLIDECNEVTQTSDGGFILCGRTFSFSTAGDYDVYVVKTNDQGNVQWSKTYGGSGTIYVNDYGYSIQQTRDLGYIITGETYSFGSGFFNLYLVKTDSLGNSGCNEGVPPTAEAIYFPQSISPPTIELSGGSSSSPATVVNSGGIPTQICLANKIYENDSHFNSHLFPNPVSTIATLEYQSNESSDITISIFNITGVKVYNLIMEKNQNGKHVITLDLTNLNPGIYICTISSYSKSKTLKVIKN